MGKCKICGADLNGAKFCPECGVPANGNAAMQQAHVGVPIGADTRQRSLADMEHMINYFGAYTKVYDDFDAVSQEVTKRSARGYGGWIGAAIVSAGIGIFSEAVFFYIAAVVFVALFILLKKMNKDKLMAATKRQEAIFKKLSTYYEEYGYCAIGLEYTKPATLQVLYELVRKGRASTPGDAINIYLADLEQAEMHRLQEEATEAAKNTEKYTKQTAKYAKKTARTSRKAAIYSGASFWFK